MMKALIESRPGITTERITEKRLLMIDDYA